MRFRIHLSKAERSSYLPINYQYELSSAIYKTIDRANSAFSQFLHEQGFLLIATNTDYLHFQDCHLKASTLSKKLG
ncbi:hypothetical protein [Belliella aquatica]|uniref:hypothetical protein n=1 Tax=Belliella aquatica TaxID=1323734 RepID=UPI0035712C0D